ncbi:MAG: 5-(carboxyamino)imidazole ribonucleotide mutase [Actinobacteria bacterium]|nr:5-(carboxyamino)imidazole ribonucleotide mutase [Actinomycetota bacterium]
MSVRVGIVLGSKSDLPYAEETVRALRELGIRYELRILSAHRTPRQLEAYASGVRARGIQVLIGLAGHAAALPGTLAALTTLPVIGVPLPTSDLAGQDALLAIAQMPPGVPVGTMALGKPGARNAALFAAAILALAEPAVGTALEALRAQMAERVLRDDAEAQPA